MSRHLEYINNTSTTNYEIWWIAISAIATFVSAAVLVFTLLASYLERKSKIDNLKASLKTELITNLDTVFSGGVDRPVLLDAIRKLRSDYILNIKDEVVFSSLQSLYLEIGHYSKFVRRYYRTNTLQEKYITERQLITCNEFLGYFNLKKISYNIDKLNHQDNGQRYIESRRDVAKKIKENNFAIWKETISKNIDRML